MKSFINRVSRFCLHESLGILLIRVITGIIFAVHGWSKFQNLPGTEQFFSMLGLSATMAVVVAFFELVGGVALILGVATRFFGVALGIIMLYAIYLTYGKMPSHEFEALLAAAAFGIALIGSGRYAFFAMQCRDCGGMLCKPGDESCSKR